MAGNIEGELCFNTQAAFLGRFFDDVGQNLVGRMTLTICPNAPTKLSDELSQQLVVSKQVIYLAQKSKSIASKLRQKYKFVLLAPLE